MRNSSTFLYFLPKKLLFTYQFCICLFEVDRLTEHVYYLLLLPHAVGQTTEAERHETIALSLVGLNIPLRAVVTCYPLPLLHDGPADGYQSEHSVVAVNAQLLAGVLKYLCHNLNRLTLQSQYRTP